MYICQRNKLQYIVFRMVIYEKFMYKKFLFINFYYMVKFSYSYNRLHDGKILFRP